MRQNSGFQISLQRRYIRNWCCFELGVGFNTPSIIRFPFEKLAKEHTNINLIRLNFDQAIVPESLGARAVGIDADMAKSIRDIVSNNVNPNRNNEKVWER